MNKYFAAVLLPVVLIFTISSCTKTGPEGPAGPLSTGTLTGYITIYDQYGYKVPGDISGVSVSIPGLAGDTITTTAAGAYTFNNLKTGIYNLVYARPGCGTVLANDVSFLAIRNVIVAWTRRVARELFGVTIAISKERETMAYIATAPESYQGQVVGSGQCVAFVQQASGAPLTANWSQGDLVRGNSTIQAGTAITGNPPALWLFYGVRRVGTNARGKGGRD